VRAITNAQPQEANIIWLWRGMQKTEIAGRKVCQNWPHSRRPKKK